MLGADVGRAAAARLTPVFYGCFDWHSSVHGHWLLARLVREFPDAAFAAPARAALAASFTEENVAEELAYLQGAGTHAFERPYGLAWLLQLTAELRSWDDADARRWAAVLRAARGRGASAHPRMAAEAALPDAGRRALADRICIRARFATGRWLRATNAMRALIDERSRSYYLADVDCPLAYEPSGEDFLSPCLAEADLMRRVLAPSDYSSWLGRFLPGIPADGRRDWLEPGIVTDRTDPKLAHIDGLNLSRAWMLRWAWRQPCRRRAAACRARHLRPTRHADAALPAVTGEHYEGGHWLGSFAVYLLGGSGRPEPP